MTGRPCDIPSAGHDGAARLYPCGWRCTSHAPQGLTTSPPEPAAVTPLRPAARTTPMATVPQIAGALRIDCGEGFAIKEDGPGFFRWKTEPRARYECLVCRWESEAVTGAAAVKAFVAHIRTTHQAICTGAITEGAHAA